MTQPEYFAAYQLPPPKPKKRWKKPLAYALGGFILLGAIGEAASEDTNPASDTTPAPLERRADFVTHRVPVKPSATPTPSPTPTFSPTPDTDVVEATAAPTPEPVETTPAPAPTKAAVKAPAPKPTKQASAPSRKPTKAPAKPAPKPTKAAVKPAPAPAKAYYKNCTEVRKAGKAPIYRGQPGYAKHLDRDGDDIACE